MPRKTKEQKELENKEKELKKTTTTKKKATTKKATASKKAPAKTSVAQKSTTTKKSSTKKDTKKTTATAKKSTTKKATASKRKTSTTKKEAKTTRKRATKKTVEIVEYYDLPYRYNQTVVKVLAQTPTNLFIYWDISDKDRENFKKQYGENFFETTKPILIVHNDTLGYSFEVEINDFANSWYLHVADSKCEYRVELGRRPIAKTEKLNTDYIYISMSNEIEAPNDRILFDKSQKMVYFRNVKNGQQTAKPINTLSFIRNMGKIYDIYDLYKSLYPNGDVEGIYDLSNPSS